MNLDVLRNALYLTLPHLPVTLTCLLGCVLVGANAKRLAAGTAWAMLGFALAALISVAGPASQAVMQSWARQHAFTVQQMATGYGTLAIVWSLLGAVSFGMLIAGVIVGRPETPPIVPMYPPQQPPPMPGYR